MPADKKGRTEPPRESWRLVNLSRYWHSSSIAELPVAVCLSFCGRDIAERFHQPMM
ncbi:MAG: hypothetical protein CBARDMAM_7052, partial [uncultured Caballeronia sp.]